MDWWKLFSGTFVLIFLAELGDKTQLAAMAKTADSPDGSTAKWVVFLGASLALVASTFIAVFLGQALKALVPDERWIKIAAGALFLVFGFMILYETYRSYAAGSDTETPPGAAAAKPGLAGGLALRAAMDFETLAMERYRRLAASAESPDVAALLLDLAREEEGHLARLRGLPERDRCDVVWNSRTGGVSGRETAAAAGLDQLIRHEESTAAFYRDLAGRTLIPSVRAVLTTLAAEEQSHADRLKAIA